MPPSLFLPVMIKHRNSDDHLHSQVILDKISAYDIFRHYCSNFKELGVKFCSDLREDNKPGVSIIDWKGTLLYKDFAYEDHTFNCFGYVMCKYGLDFVGALQLISQDFGLGLTSTDVIPGARTYSYTRAARRETIIQIKRRPWSARDAEYWSTFCIPKSLLIKFDVYPIEYFWINETRFHPSTVTYAFRFASTRFKIYSPHEEDYKWYSNVGRETIQGFQQLPGSGEVVYLTSSLKDVMCLGVLQCPAVALQSEMLVPHEDTIQSLQERFKEVIVLYDNDFDKEINSGQEMAEKICRTYGLTNLVIPSYYRSKDISDLIRDHGLETAKDVITRSENRSTTHKKQSTECKGKGGGRHQVSLDAGSTLL